MISIPPTSLHAILCHLVPFFSLLREMSPHASWHSDEQFSEAILKSSLLQQWLWKVPPLDEKGLYTEKMSLFPSRKDKPQKSQRRANQRHCAREGLVETHMKLKDRVATENRCSHEAKARKLLKNGISGRKVVSLVSKTHGDYSNLCKRAFSTGCGLSSRRVG